jgi:hypothetical protein
MDYPACGLWWKVIKVWIVIARDDLHMSCANGADIKKGYCQVIFADDLSLD